ncbi:MAG: outer membrane lipoprotein chaperone LolA [Myxococcota bacterium]
MRLRLASLLALGCVAATAAWADAVPEPTSESCRDTAATAVQKRYDGVRDLRARFVQTTRPVSLGGGTAAKTTSRGTVVLAKPGKMRWSYEAPEPSLVVSDGKTLWLYDPGFREAQKLPAGEGFLSGAAAQFLLGAGDMRRDFEVTAVSCQAYEVELELVPKTPASYEKLYLTVDPRAGDVRQTRVVDLLGNIAEVAFEDLRVNQRPGAEVFQFVPPEGVKVVELSP